MSDAVSEKNRASWNAFAGKYAAFSHGEDKLNAILKDPGSAFHAAAWGLLSQYIGDFSGKRVCVPSSGDNLAVLAFAALGARVTSCDIAERQLENAHAAAARCGLDGAITFVRADTMGLAGIEDGSYDLVYTSNGVHVWIDDLARMYQSVYRVLKPGGAYVMYEIHPFQRPFDDGFKVMKPYDDVGPYDDGGEITFHWRLQDILNAQLDAGLRLSRVEEAFAEKDYETPFWLPLEELVDGAKATREQIDRMHDWRYNPVAALPNWLCLATVKR